jgi:hypothetical protein
VTNVVINTAPLPNNTTADVFAVTGLVRITGLAGRIEVEADDPYTVAVRVGGNLTTSVNIGSQAVGSYIQGAAGAGPSLADMFASDTTISASSTNDPGLGEVEWIVTYEPLAPGATIVAA